MRRSRDLHQGSRVDEYQPRSLFVAGTALAFIPATLETGSESDQMRAAASSRSAPPVGPYRSSHAIRASSMRLTPSRNADQVFVEGLGKEDRGLLRRLHRWFPIRRILRET